MISGDAIVLGLLLSLLAGISTTIGSAIAFFVKRPTKRFLCLSMSFSAGVMIAVSFLELMNNSIIKIGLLQASAAFFAGIILIFMIDFLIPHSYKEERGDRGLMRLGLLIALGIAIHNFPEGFSVFVGSLESVQAGLILAIAVAIHNIPEGISISVPIFSATRNRKTAFKYSSLSGLSEPLGALIGAVILLPFLTDFVVSLMLAFVAGVMVYISFDELLPMAHKYESGHVTTLGVILGMLVMVVTLIMLKI